ncbi:hypothetical protein BDP27DRAFT_1427602 [Rhodocollybia butyracea]|uniref:Uncharacterized protein n=1 Tax=Rhodocollybia butyracea TaxID=206335 RepID=A0A9P5PGH8_9AGAR|nr:hypothetical protein BDP27DRAFT_1427602 [Rhodocollybia butyracea]
MAPQSDTKDLAFSGYSMNATDFAAFIHSLHPNLEPEEDETDIPMSAYFILYDDWRRKQRRINPKVKLPFILVIYDNGDPPEISLNADGYTRVVFPVRWVPYKDPEQCDPNGKFAELWTPQELDTAKLNEFVRIVKENGGELDISKVAFICHREKINPAYSAFQ